MRQSVIYEIPSLYRENFRIHGYHFGEGNAREWLVAPCDGVVFFLHNDPMTYANTAVVKLLPQRY